MSSLHIILRGLSYSCKKNKKQREVLFVVLFFVHEIIFLALRAQSV